VDDADDGADEDAEDPEDEEEAGGGDGAVDVETDGTGARAVPVLAQPATVVSTATAARAARGKVCTGTRLVLGAASPT
jgi:hypothetical protein